MPRIYKPKYPRMMKIGNNRVPVRYDGKIVYRESRKYYIDYTDADGIKKTCPGYTDKLATEQFASQLERQVEREKVGIVDVPMEQIKAPIDTHIVDWVNYLRDDRNRSKKYVHNLEARINLFKRDLEWVTLVSIQPDGVIRWIGEHRSAMSQRTLNHHLQALKTFCNWCVSRRRLEKNPVGHIASIEVTSRIIRRALTLDEIGKLLAKSGQRKLVYQMALLTGLRRNELKQLQWSDVHLESNPRIELRAETTKAGRADTLPLPDQIVLELRVIRPININPSTRVFASVPKAHTFNSDLEEAGIAKVDNRGWKADFHSLRVTYGSLLAKTGASLREAMQLMRHTDARLTTQIIPIHGYWIRLRR